MDWESLSVSIENANLPESTECLATPRSRQGSPRVVQPDPRTTQSAPSTPTLLRKVDNCFGFFDGVAYDVSGLTVTQFLVK